MSLVQTICSCIDGRSLILVHLSTFCMLYRSEVGKNQIAFNSFLKYVPWEYIKIDYLTLSIRITKILKFLPSPDSLVVWSSRRGRWMWPWSTGCLAHVSSEPWMIRGLGALALRTAKGAAPLRAWSWPSWEEIRQRARSQLPSGWAPIDSSREGAPVCQTNSYLIWSSQTHPNSEDGQNSRVKETTRLGVKQGLRSITRVSNPNN